MTFFFFLYYRDLSYASPNLGSNLNMPVYTLIVVDGAVGVLKGLYGLRAPI